MSLEKLMEIRDKYEAKIGEIDNLSQKCRRLKQLIINANGRKLEQVVINDIDGCTAIPELILELANERLKEYEAKMNDLLYKETASTY